MDDQGLARPETNSVHGFMHNKYVRLRAVLPRDVANLYRAFLSEDLFMHYRYRGATPSFDEFQRDIHRDVLAHFIVQTASRPPRPVGLVRAHGLNFRSRIAYLAAYSFPSAKGSGLMASGVELFITFLFRCWDIRQIFVEVLEFNLPQFQTAFGSVFAEQGRLGEFEYFDGRYWDLIVGCLRRDHWDIQKQKRSTDSIARGRALIAADVIDPDQFLAYFRGLLAELGVPVRESVQLDTTLVDGLGLDSLTMFELTDLFAGLAPSLELEDLPMRRDANVRDLYLLYLQAAQMPAG